MLRNLTFGFQGGGGSSSGGVTSVGLQMPSAFNVANTPITTSGDISVSGAGTQSQYVRGDGTLANFPNVGGGGGQIYYFNGNTSQGTILGNTYYQLGLIAGSGASANFTRATTGVIAYFITDINVPNQINIPSGNWAISIYLSESGGGSQHAEITATLFKYNGSTITDISTSPIEEITNGSTLDLYNFDISVGSATILSTDRLGIYFSISNTNGKTVTLYTEDSTIGQVATTFSTGITSINGLTSSTQILSTGTSGNDFSINSSTSTHTFNLPIASAINSGKLSNSDWSIFNNKPSDDVVILGQQGLGSTVKSVGLACRTWGNITLQTALTDGSIFLIAIYLPQSATITGVKWWQNVQGNYTADNENRVGLYSYSGGTLTLVASSTDDGNLWKGASASVQSKAFTTPYVASVGVYFIGLLYNSSAQPTPPQIGSAPNKLNGGLGDFTNSAKFNSSIASTTLSSSIAMSGTSTTQGNWGAFLY